VLSAEASVMRDINHISVSVGPPVMRDYRIDQNGTVVIDANKYLQHIDVFNDIRSTIASRIQTLVI
jgi:hypothetical protein